MKKVLYLVLVVFAALLLLIRFGGLISSKVFSSGQRGGIKITTIPGSTVFINDQQVGTTPYQDENLIAGEYKVKVASGSAVWEGQVPVVKGTLSVVNRELSENAASASGEILVLSDGSGSTITSTPTGADVDIDGQSMGKTPLSLATLKSGDHTFTLSHDGYLKRSVRAFVPDNLKLQLDVDMAISEVDLSSLAAPQVNVAQQAVVTNTPTGFLRVRDQAGLNGNEVERVAPGDTVTVLDESNGWSKVRLADGKEGYVSSQYITKK